MSTSDTPWEPPLAGTEVEHLVGALDRLRATFRWKAGGLDAADLRARVGASALTLGGLLKHLAAVEDFFEDAGFAEVSHPTLRRVVMRVDFATVSGASST